MIKFRAKKLEIPEGCSKCPRCLHVGPIPEDFGYRWMYGKKKSQSQCRLCRSSGKNRPTPGSRFKDQLPKLGANSSMPTDSNHWASGLALASAKSARPAGTTRVSASVDAANSTTAATTATDAIASASTYGQLLLFGGVKPLRKARRKA